MSRRSDIDLAERILVKLPSGSCVRKALESAYDLGRAAQAQADSNSVAICVYGDADRLPALAKRLRARVNRILEVK